VAGKLAEVENIGTVVEEIGIYFATVLLGLFIHGVIVLPLIYLVLTRSNPLKLVKAVLQALLTAFGTSSRSVILMLCCLCLQVHVEVLGMHACMQCSYEGSVAVKLSRIQHVSLIINSTDQLLLASGVEVFKSDAHLGCSPQLTDLRKYVGNHSKSNPWNFFIYSKWYVQPPLVVGCSHCVMSSGQSLGQLL